MNKESAQLSGRPGRGTMLLLIAGLVVILALVGISLATRARQHSAATYGFTDPSQAALRIDNRTTDFAVRSISLEDAQRSVAIQDFQREIGPGDQAVLEIAPGTYRVNVLFVETVQVTGWRPEGTLSELVSVLPGRAAIVSFQGGNSSPDRPIYIPPELVVK